MLHILIMTPIMLFMYYFYLLLDMFIMSLPLPRKFQPVSVTNCVWKYTISFQDVA